MGSVFVHQLNDVFKACKKKYIWFEDDLMIVFLYVEEKNS